MRHLVLALMILLLPLRGWTGDTMATDMAIEMAASVAHTTKIIAAGAHNKSPKDHFEHQTSVQTVPASALQAHLDCAGHAADGAATSGQEEQDGPDGHCNPCQSCQACHTVALSSSPPDARSAFAAPSVPRAVAAQFTSALTALGQKPPIS